MKNIYPALTFGALLIIGGSLRLNGVTQDSVSGGWYELEARFAGSPLVRILGGCKATMGMMKMGSLAPLAPFWDPAAKIAKGGYRDYGEGLYMVINGADAEDAKAKQTHLVPPRPSADVDQIDFSES